MAAKLGQGLFADLGVEHLVPKNVRRCVIDVKHDDAIRVYFETFGEPELLDKIVPHCVEHGIVCKPVDRDVGEGEHELPHAAELVRKAAQRAINHGDLKLKRRLKEIGWQQWRSPEEEKIFWNHYCSLETVMEIQERFLEELEKVKAELRGGDGES